MNRWISPEQKHLLEAHQADILGKDLTRDEAKNLVQLLILNYAEVLDAIVQEEEGERNDKMSRKMNKTCRQNLKRDNTPPKG